MMAAAGFGNGMNQRLVPIVEWMKIIPAACIPHDVRKKLSKILDPPRHLENLDYRSFADKIGITPDTCQWLDSQKVVGKQSSICQILEHKEHDSNFTVYTVYHALQEMHSAGEDVILQKMPDIIRMYNMNYGSRRGQQHTEPSSPASSIPGNISPPPPYSLHDTQGSENISGGASGYQVNGLGAGCMSPGNSRSFGDPGNSRSFGECQPGENSFYRPGPERQVYRPGPEENSYLSGPNPQVFNGRQPDENSDSFASAPDGPGMCGSRYPLCYSCTGSHVQPSSGYQSVHTVDESTTAMMELKLPLQVVARSAHQSHIAERSSFPATAQPSYKSKKSTSRPISDGSFASGQQTFVKQRPGMDCFGPVNQRQNINPSIRPDDTASYPYNNGSCFLDHQTFVKQSQELNGFKNIHDGMMSQHLNPLSPAERGNTTLNTGGIPGCQSLPAAYSTPQAPLQQHKSVSMIPYEPKSSQCQSDYFLFILAADIEETNQLRNRVMSLSQRLMESGIPHIAMSSAFVEPVIYLPPHLKNRLYKQETQNGNGCSPLLAQGFSKAAKVVMMVSPGYQRYADKFAKGGTSAANEQQRTIQGFHEDLKTEFFNNTRQRVLPVLHLNAKRDHMPSFLHESVYYFYPPRPDTEDFLALLKCEWINEQKLR